MNLPPLSEKKVTMANTPRALHFRPDCCRECWLPRHWKNGSSWMRRRKRRSGERKRLRGNFLALAADSSSLAAEPRLALGPCINDHGKFIAWSGSHELFRAKHTSKHESFRLMLAAQKLAVIQPIARGIARVIQQPIQSQRALKRLRCSRNISLFFLQVS